jgi:hypothetical protein
MSKNAAYTGFILAADFVWACLLSAGFLGASAIADWLQREDLLRSGPFPYTLVIAVLAGGAGGLSAGLNALAKHHLRRDFKYQHFIWYLITPGLGCVLGLFSCIVVTLLFPLSGIEVYIAAVLAWVAGFRQNDIPVLTNTIRNGLLAKPKR